VVVLKTTRHRGKSPKVSWHSVPAHELPVLVLSSSMQKNKSDFFFISYGSYSGLNTADPSARLSAFPLRLPLRTATLGLKVNPDQLIEDGSLNRQYM
jgi:hypothetical protein